MPEIPACFHLPRFLRHDRTYRNVFNTLRDGDEEAIPLSVLEKKLRDQSKRRGVELTDLQVQRLLNEADTNKDQQLTVDEFESLMTSKSAQASQMARLMYAISDSVIAPSQRSEFRTYIDAYTCIPPPVFMLIISLAQVMTFLMYHWRNPDKTVTVWNDCAGCFIDGGTKAGPLIFTPFNREEVWRFVSYMLLHGGLTHLLGNVIMQLIVGVPLEVVHKVWRIGPLYLFAVITGALLQYTLDPSILLVGCSAGVYALLTAHLANIFMNWSEMPYRWVRLIIIGGYVSLDIGSTLYSRLILQKCDNVSHAGHFAGALTGFMAGVFLLYNLVELRWERIVKYVAICLYLLFILVCIVMTVVRKPLSAPFFDKTPCKEKNA